jgi:hypothetical protein
MSRCIIVTEYDMSDPCNHKLVRETRYPTDNAPFERVPNEKGWERDHWNAMMERVKEPEGPYYKENMKRLQEQAFKDRKKPEETFLLGELRKQGIESVELLKEIRDSLNTLCRPGASKKDEQPVCTCGSSNWHVNIMREFDSDSVRKETRCGDCNNILEIDTSGC